MERGLHSFTTRHCGIPTHQLLPSLSKSRPSLAAATPCPRKQRSLKQAVSLLGSPMAQAVRSGSPCAFAQGEIGGLQFLFAGLFLPLHLRRWPLLALAPPCLGSHPSPWQGDCSDNGLRCPSVLTNRCSPDRVTARSYLL